MGNGRVAWFEEGLTNGVADLVAFGIDGLNVKRETGSKGIKDSLRRDGFDMGTDGCKRGASNYFLEEDVCRSRRKQREQDGRRRRVRVKSDGFIALGAKGGSRDNGRVELNLDGIEQGVGVTWEQRNTSKV